MLAGHISGLPEATLPVTVQKGADTDDEDQGGGGTEQQELPTTMPYRRLHTVSPR
jgi:hypothetical protein